MLQLDDMDNEIIRRAPKGAVSRLATLFRRTPRHIKRIRSGACGLPLQNGLGARPHVLRELDLIEQWYERYLAKGAAMRRRALECVAKDEPISLEVEPTDEEALSRLGKPGTLALFKNRLALIPYVPPPAPTAPVPAKTTAGLFYDRR
jgi:hypothetical protein